LHELWTRHRKDVFGTDTPDTPRFPLLAKILDARETLSVQVHPPAAIAAELGGEPKTEMWYLLNGTADACVYAGFKKRTTREDFEAALEHGGIEHLLHRLPVKRGDAIFIPSGRCHAIGGGCLIVEMQQNSDTTYRVFDWNRAGLDGRPRPLHLRESLLSIDFSDQEPSLATRRDDGVIVACEHFRVEEWLLTAPRQEESAAGAIFAVIDGSVSVGTETFQPGDFFLLPAASTERSLAPKSSCATVLRTTLGARQ
jgi:mannose-6-phosphate isomerase